MQVGRGGGGRGEEEQDGGVRSPAEEDCRHHQHGHTGCSGLLSKRSKMFRQSFGIQLSCLIFGVEITCRAARQRHARASTWWRRADLRVSTPTELRSPSLTETWTGWWETCWHTLDSVSSETRSSKPCAVHHRQVGRRGEAGLASIHRADRVAPDRAGTYVKDYGAGEVGEVGEVVSQPPGRAR